MEPDDSDLDTDPFAELEYGCGDPWCHICGEPDTYDDEEPED